MKNNNEPQKKKNANEKFERFYKRAIKQILAPGFPKNAEELKSNLYIASTHKAHKYIDIYLKKGADPNNIGSLDRSIVHRIVINLYDEDMIKSLEIALKYKNMPNNPLKPKFNTLDEYGYPPAFYITMHKPEQIKKILEFGIDIKATDREVYNALYYAAEKGYYDIIPFLESLGLKWNININPLAQKYGKENCVILWETNKKTGNQTYTDLNCFVRKAVDPDKIEWGKNKDQSALSIALRERRRLSYKLAFYLVRECGADPNYQDKEGRTFLHNLALDSSFWFNEKECDGSEPSIQFLSFPGLKINQLDNAGYSFLAYWVTKRCPYSTGYSMKTILDKGADPFFYSPDGYNLIELICIGRFLDDSEYTIGRDDKAVPIHHLTNCGVEYRSRKNPEGLTCLELLRKYEKKRCIEITKDIGTQKLNHF